MPHGGNSRELSVAVCCPVCDRRFDVPAGRLPAVCEGQEPFTKPHDRATCIVLEELHLQPVVHARLFVPRDYWIPRETWDAMSDRLEDYEELGMVRDVHGGLMSEDDEMRMTPVEDEEPFTLEGLFAQIDDVLEAHDRG